MTNSKIDRIEKEMQKTREKISEYQNRLKELAAQKNVDGGILFTHWGCKGTIGASSLIKGSLEEAGIPTMILDGDGCNPANSSDGQISTRLQAYMEMLKVNKAEKYAANPRKGGWVR